MRPGIVAALGLGLVLSLGACSNTTPDKGGVTYVGVRPCGLKPHHPPARWEDGRRPCPKGSPGYELQHPAKPGRWSGLDRYLDRNERGNR